MSQLMNPHKYTTGGRERKLKKEKERIGKVRRNDKNSKQNFENTERKPMKKLRVKKKSNRIQ